MSQNDNEMIGSLTSFLFGNIDSNGELESDILDDDAKKSIFRLSNLGLNSILEQVVGDEGYVGESSSSNDESAVHSLPSNLDDVEKLENAIDYSDIKELATDENQLDSETDSSQNDDLHSSTSDANASGTECGQNEASKLRKPLASMLPEKYANVDVTTLFPDFRPDKVLRFSQLFGSNKGKTATQSLWRSVRKRRKRNKEPEVSKKYRGSELHYGSLSDFEIASDDEDKLLRPLPEKEVETEVTPDPVNDTEPKVADWRFGPAQLWYDMLNVPEDGEGFDYGFKLKEKKEGEQENDEKRHEDLDDDAFLMISQLNWEDDVIWNGETVKNTVMKNLKTKCQQAGWLPYGGNRTAQLCYQGNKASQQSNSVGQGRHQGGSKSYKSSSAKQDRQGQQQPQNQPHSPQSQPDEMEQSQTDDSVDDTWYSMFPPENYELINTLWEDEIIWDAEAMDKIPKPRILTLDPNDENIILGIPDDIDPTKQKHDFNSSVKVKIPHPHVKKSKLLLGKAGVINVIQEDAPPPPLKCLDQDPLNVSNDWYYQPRTQENALRLTLASGGNIIQHSTPVVELRAPFIQTQMGLMRLRNFHRPPLKRYSHGLLVKQGHHPVYPLVKNIKRKAKQREQERIAAGGGDMFFMRTPEDLTARDGELILMEFCEEHPPLVNQVGMCSNIKNYYKRKMGKDTGPPNLKYGDVAYVHTSPFLGLLQPGKCIQVVENNLYRAPIYEHRCPPTDFLVIRTRERYFIREFEALFLAGQLCPLYEVPGPNSKRANNFMRDFLQVFIYRLFWRSRDIPKRIRMDDIRKAFPSHSESSIRKRLKLCADFKRTGLDSNWWVIKPDFRLPPEDEIRAMVSPEQCCAYFSMLAAEQRLKDAGYGEKFLFTPQDDDDEDTQLKIDDEIKVAPWNTTRAFIQAMKNKCLLQLTGPADPTGCGEGFSYVRVPNKPAVKEEQETQPKRMVTGTDADLRRLSLNNAKALLRKFRVPEEEIKKLSRWEVIDVVRTLSTEKAKAGEQGMTKFSRGNRFSIAEHQERYKEECQRIFDLQNRVLSSAEVLSTDEEESTEEETSDIEQMGKNIEHMLATKKTSSQLSLEKEEQERQELRKMFMDSANDEDTKSKSANRRLDGRVLKIYRTFRDTDGNTYTRMELVRNIQVIDGYVKVRTTKDDGFIKQFAVFDDAQKEEMKREKRRIQEQLRRIKRNQEKERDGSEIKTFSGTWSNPKKAGREKNGQSSLRSGGKESRVSRRRPPKVKPDLKVKCGACGATGHMRTNRACPQYHLNAPPPPVNVALTQEEEREIERELNNDCEDLVNVDGTKVKLSSRLIKHAEEVKRRSLVLKVPKEVMRKRRRSTKEPHCDYLSKHQKPANRRRTDPVVVFSTLLESILNEMRQSPDVQPFLFPVNGKVVPDYNKIVSRPMDLQTVRENIRQKSYQTRQDFLADVNQIVENSTVYNGGKSSLTLAAKRMLQLCIERLKDKEDVFMRLEKVINPLLDDDDQVALSFILMNVANKLKVMPESWPFAKPVNKRMVKDYYDVVKHPMDLETLCNNIKAHKYHTRYEFLADLDLIVQNCIAYNGKDSSYTAKAETVYKTAAGSLEGYNDHLSMLENKIKIVQERAKNNDDTDYDAALDYDLDQMMQSPNASGAGERSNATATETQQVLDDLNCSSEEDADDMMEEVRGIDITIKTSPSDYEQQLDQGEEQVDDFSYGLQLEESVAEGDGMEEDSSDHLDLSEFVKLKNVKERVPSVQEEEHSPQMQCHSDVVHKDLEISDSDDDDDMVEVGGYNENESEYYQEPGPSKWAH